MDLKVTAAVFFASIESLNAFDKMEVRPVVSPSTNREFCYVGSYARCAAYVQSVLRLTEVADSQAIAPIARSILELAVDIRLLSVIPDGADRMIAYVDVERLRAARSVIQYTTTNPSTQINVAPFEEFIQANAARIDAERVRLWPGVKNSNLRHWANLDLRQRVQRLKGEVEELHAQHYAQLSFYAHPGMTGILNMPVEAFHSVAGTAFSVIFRCYMLVMDAVIEEFNLSTKDPKIKAKMKLAHMLPFTEGPEQAAKLQQALLGVDDQSEGGR